MENLTMILMMAVTAEALIQLLKEAVQDKKINRWLIVGMGLGVLLAFAADLDLFEALGVSMRVPALGTILTGLFVGRGSNFVFDLFNRLKNPQPEKDKY